MASSSDFARNLAAGTLSGCSVVMTFNPLDCLRIRWQVSKHSQADSLWSFSRQIIKTEGFWGGLWRPGLLSNGASASVSVGTRLGSYELIRDSIISQMGHQGKHPTVMWFSGLIPGLVGYWVSTPLWQVKTRIQAEAGVLKDGIYVTGARAGKPPEMTNLIEGLAFIIKNEGFVKLYRGATALMFRGGMMSSGQFLGYDWTKTNAKAAGLLQEGPVLHVLASTVAAFLSTTFAAPFDIVFTRMQAAPTLGIHYDGVLDCARAMVREEGVMVFYRGWTVFFSRVAPVFTVMMPLWEQTRRLFGLNYMN
mmetsp:Transcript_2540/g.4966  ORF Transcript_2540/g.4966 Transcript_2540/m.4966 type:complete len:307 (-) Transcript_2540:105-1025(-)